jgi:hypothetical protein
VSVQVLLEALAADKQRGGAPKADTDAAARNRRPCEKVG